MNIELEPGRYVIAVSGGVDSTALLHMLHTNFQLPTSNFQFIVAHFDHGIRDDAVEDRRLVQAIAQDYGLRFVYDEGNLGPDTSEATARSARYSFLHRLREASAACAVITAHHQDDLLETMLINMLRGTGRKGLVSLASKGVLRRPLLEITKQEIVEYARAHQLVWHEDGTNADTRYLRNHIRQNVMPKLSPDQRQKLLHIHDKLKTNDAHIDRLVTNYLHQQPAANTLERRSFTNLSHAEAREVMTAWLRQSGMRGYDKSKIEQLVVAAKTLAPGKCVSIGKGLRLEVKTSLLALKWSDR